MKWCKSRCSNCGLKKRFAQPKWTVNLHLEWQIRITSVVFNLWSKEAGFKCFGIFALRSKKKKEKISCKCTESYKLMILQFSVKFRQKIPIFSLSSLWIFGWANIFFWACRYVNGPFPSKKKATGLNLWCKRSGQTKASWNWRSKPNQQGKPKKRKIMCS